MLGGIDCGVAFMAGSFHQGADNIGSGCSFEASAVARQFGHKGPQNPCLGVPLLAQQGLPISTLLLFNYLQVRVETPVQGKQTFAH